MGAVQLVLLPVLTVALFAGWLAARTRWSQARLLAVGALFALDAWCWLAVLEPPLGPHSRLMLVLLLVNLPFALALIQSATGFRMRGRGLPWQPSRDRPIDYDGYRGD